MTSGQRCTRSEVGRSLYTTVRVPYTHLRDIAPGYLLPPPGYIPPGNRVTRWVYPSTLPWVLHLYTTLGTALLHPWVQLSSIPGYSPPSHRWVLSSSHRWVLGGLNTAGCNMDLNTAGCNMDLNTAPGLLVPLLGS